MPTAIGPASVKRRRLRSAYPHGRAHNTAGPMVTPSVICATVALTAAAVHYGRASRPCPVDRSVGNWVQTESTVSARLPVGNGVLAADVCRATKRRSRSGDD